MCYLVVVLELLEELTAVLMHLLGEALMQGLGQGCMNRSEGSQGLAYLLAGGPRGWMHLLAGGLLACLKAEGLRQVCLQEGELVQMCLVAGGPLLVAIQPGTQNAWLSMMHLVGHLNAPQHTLRYLMQSVLQNGSGTSD